MSSIRLSPKHGVNPCLSVCFWCGEEKNEIALLGKLKDDLEAPRTAVLNYEPCDSCKEKMSLGVTAMEITERPNSVTMTPMKTDQQQEVYPTGRWVVLKKEAVQRMFNIEEVPEKFFCDKELMDQFKEPVSNN